MGAPTQSVLGDIQEIFFSVQGEGLWAGRLQHFIRFKGCDVGCSFCDTPGASFREDDPQSRTEHLAFRESMTADQVLDFLKTQARLHPGAHSIAVTGGEPLIQCDFLEAVLGCIEGAFPKMDVLLETAGLHWEEMERVKERIGLVSMDFKLPSTSGLHGTRDRHEKFLSVLKGINFYVKAIVDPRTPSREVVEAAKTVLAHDPRVPFFLQPVTREGRVWGGAYLLDLWSAARENLEDVRVLPQIHRSLSLS
jgi:organic radical activating enzyme